MDIKEIEGDHDCQTIIADIEEDFLIKNKNRGINILDKYLLGILMVKHEESVNDRFKLIKSLQEFI